MAELSSQCERNPLCTRGFKHQGRGGHCSLRKLPSSLGGRSAERVATVRPSPSAQAQLDNSLLQVGCLTLACDAFDLWFPARVLQRSGGSVFIAAEGFDSQHQEWLHIDSGRLAPLALLLRSAEGAVCEQCHSEAPEEQVLRARPDIRTQAIDRPDCSVFPLLTAAALIWQLLLCDGCNFALHTFCASPPLAGIPAGQWFCRACARAIASAKERATRVVEREAAKASSTPTGGLSSGGGFSGGGGGECSGGRGRGGNGGRGGGGGSRGGGRGGGRRGGRGGGGGAASPRKAATDDGQAGVCTWNISSHSPSTPGSDAPRKVGGPAGVSGSAAKDQGHSGGAGRLASGEGERTSSLADQDFSGAIEERDLQERDLPRLAGAEAAPHDACGSPSCGVRSTTLSWREIAPSGAAPPQLTLFRVREVSPVGAAAAGSLAATGDATELLSVGGSAQLEGVIVEGQVRSCQLLRHPLAARGSTPPAEAAPRPPQVSHSMRSAHIWVLPFLSCHLPTACLPTACLATTCLAKDLSGQGPPA